MRYRFLGVELDTARFALIRDGDARTLSPKVFRVLECLVRSPHRVVSKAELLDAAWSGLSVTENSLNQIVRQVRELLAARTPSSRCTGAATASPRPWRCCATRPALPASTTLSGNARAWPCSPSRR